MTDLEGTLQAIRHWYGKRRFAMKTQSKLDRSLESHIRRWYTDWSPDMPEKEREKRNKLVRAMIAAAKRGKSDNLDITGLVSDNETARAPADAQRSKAERRLAELVSGLPIAAFADNVPGFNIGGLAIIIGETTSPNLPLSFSSYTRKGIDGVYSRLGLAPYDGRAGSTWKRDKWRPRSLTADEWKAHPFSGERYAGLHMIAVSLRNAQTTGKRKTASGRTEPGGPYGEIYCWRKAYTAETRPDWTPKHRDMDALRVMLKALIADLYREWLRVTPGCAQPEGVRTSAPERATASAPLPAAAA